jgi:hypothetical protein
LVVACLGEVVDNVVDFFIVHAYSMREKTTKSNLFFIFFKIQIEYK